MTRQEAKHSTVKPLVKRVALFLMATTLLSHVSPLHSNEPTRIAVATNFAPVLSRLAEHYYATTDRQIETISGSTGKLYAQIANGMPFDMFLSADQHRPTRLLSEGLAVESTQFTYAIGRLVWWQPNSSPSFNEQNLLVLGSDVQYLALAQPDVAPYGLAAAQSLERCFEINQERVNLVYSENIGQTYAQVATGNADAGLIALASVLLGQSVQSSEYTLVPEHCHEPIKQDAVLLTAGPNNAEATRFMKFLQSDSIKQVIVEHGYEVP